MCVCASIFHAVFALAVDVDAGLFSVFGRFLNDESEFIFADGCDDAFDGEFDRSCGIIILAV